MDVADEEGLPGRVSLGTEVARMSECEGPKCSEVDDDHAAGKPRVPCGCGEHDINLGWERNRNGPPAVHWLGHHWAPHCAFKRSLELLQKAADKQEFLEEECALAKLHRDQAMIRKNQAVNDLQYGLARASRTYSELQTETNAYKRLAQQKVDPATLDAIALRRQRDELEHELGRYRSGEALNAALRKQEALSAEWTKMEAELRHTRQKLATVRAGHDDVWFWQGGGDDPKSLTCPVVMAPETLRALLAEQPRTIHPGADAHDQCQQARWLAVIVYDGVPSITLFCGRPEADTYYDQRSQQWSESFLCSILAGPGPKAP